MTLIPPNPIYALLLAPFVGSFLGVLIKRLPQRRPIAISRSRCDHCGHILTSCDLIPIVSYLALLGKCRNCRTAIGSFYIVVELLALAIATTAMAFSADPAVVWCGCVLGWVLLSLAWIDWRCLILPDVLTLPLILLGLAAAYWLDSVAVTNHAIAAAVAYLGLHAIAILYRSLRRRDGLGEGDAKLFAAAGAWVGLAPLSYVLVVGATITLGAAIVSSLLTRRPLESGTRLPLGMGLCVAIWTVWLYTS